ncbi:MAG: DUF420 domain-containing protein [Calditrichaeota bacterium]|nr:MAG: DUF420 domain-containing protein [Calditrichota bacterium]
MSVTDLPTLNAILNSISTIFLILGFVYVKKRELEKHKKMMTVALISSTFFLISYLIYHYYVGSVPYGKQDWTRPVYFAILIPHIILAAVMTPFILWGVWLAWKDNFLKHAKIMKWIWPIWVFVSITGVIIYLMLYVF